MRLASRSVIIVAGGGEETPGVDDGVDTGSRSERIRRWLDGLPAGQRRTVVLASVTLLLGPVYVGMVLLAAALLGEDPDWLRPIPGMAGAFAGSFLAVRWQRRRMGGAHRVREFTRALRSGRLPGDADPAVWRALLEREQLAQRRVRMFCLVLAGIVAAGWVAIAALLTFDWVAAVVSTGLVVAVAGLVWILGSRQSARIHRLAAQLPGGTFSGPAP
ncbi:MAG: hypothetical protein ABWY29_08560 [Blastococcus sp.]